MKKIPEYDGYYADTDGSIWCDLGKGNRDKSKRTEPYQVKPRPGRNGYLTRTILPMLDHTVTWVGTNWEGSPTFSD